MTPASSGPLPRVVDASPLIGLAKVGRLGLLTAGGRTVIVTDTVAQEVQAGAEDDPARRALAQGWGERRAAAPVPPALAAWRLDAGEASVLALALTLGAVAVLDDGDGRRAARALGVLHTGTAGVVAEGKRQGLIASARDVLQALWSAGVYLPSDPLLATLLLTVDETWP